MTDEMWGVDLEVDDLVREEELRRRDEYHRNNKTKMRRLYMANKEAMVGCAIQCSYCGKLIIKKQYSQVFCSPIKTKNSKKSTCKDKYWNYVDEKRNERTKDWKNKRRIK